VLFPPWHRAYVLRIEQALQTVVSTAVLPYWDWTSDESLKSGIPTAITDEFVLIDNVKVRNPLLDFTFPVDLVGRNLERWEQ